MSSASSGYSVMPMLAEMNACSCPSANGARRLSMICCAISSTRSVWPSRRQDHREFVAAEPRHGVGLAHAGADAARRLHQQDVALVVAERVVDLLEVVEVDEQHGQAGALALAFDDVVRQPVVEHAAVGQLRERVEVGLLPDQGLAVLLGRDVLDHAQVVRMAAGLGVEHGDRHVEPGRVAVRAQHAAGGLEAGQPLFRQLRHLRLDLGGVVRVGDVEPLAGAQLLLRAADDVEVAQVQVAVLVADRVDQRDAQRRGLEHRAEALLALADGVERALALARQQAEVHGRRQHQRHRDRAQHPVQPHQAAALVVAVVQEAVEADRLGQHAQPGVDVGDVAPALRVHVADLDEHRLHQRHHLARLVQQVLAVVAARILVQDQVGGLLVVAHRPLPAAHAGGAEGARPRRMAGDLALAGEQVVAVEIDADRARAVDIVGEAEPVEQVGLVGGVDGHGVDTVDQVVRIEAGRDPLDAADRHPFPGQVGQQFVGVAGLVGERADHRALADQAADVGFAAGLAHRQPERRMLEDHAQHHHRLAGQPRQQQAAAGHAVLGLAGQHVALGLVAVGALEDAHVEPGLAVIALLERGVVAGELELVQVLEPQRDFVLGDGRRGGQQQHKKGEDGAYAGWH